MLSELTFKNDRAASPFLLMGKNVILQPEAITKYGNFPE
jgi:hypothetical protein